MITIYNKNESDLTTLGLGTINASECIVSENAGGAFDLQMTVPCEEDMKYTWLENGRILKVDCPVRETPIAQQTKGNVTRKIYKVDTGASGVRLYLRSAPDQNSKGIHAYRPDTEVAMLDDSDRNWMKVAVLDGGNVGYMWKSNLVFVRNETENVSGDNPSVIIKPTQYRKQFFRIYKVEKDSKTNSIKVDARHIFYDLVGNVIKGKYEFENKAANVVLNEILALCTNDNQFNFYCYSEENITGEFENIGLVEALLDPEKGIVKLSNSRIVRDNFDVYIIPDVVRDRGVSIRAGKNLTGVRFTVDDSNVVTRIIPMGSDKKGETVYIDGNGYVDSPLINNYATVHAKAINYGVSVGDEFKNVEAVKTEITRLANEDFENGCDLESVSLDVDFVMLGDTEEYSDFEKLQSIHLYDTVHVYYGRIGVSADIRMNGYDYDAIAKRYADVRLGDITDINDTVYSYNISDSAISTQKIARGAVNTNNIANGAVNGSKIPLAAIEIAHIDQAAINQLTADSIVAVKAEIQRIVAGEITTDELYANLAKIAVAQITTANINNANIDWASIQNLSAQIADIARAEIGTAKIDYAKITDLVTDTAIITEGVGGQLYINRLAVTDANMVSLTTGELMLKAADGSFVRLIADGHGGVTTQTVQVEGDNIANSTISGGKIIENSITARELNVANIFADQALIRAIKAANIDVANLFAAQATIDALDAYIIKASTIEALKGELNVWADKKINLTVKIGGTNLLRLENPNNGYLYAEKRVDQALIGKTFYKSGTTLTLRRPPVGSAIVNFSDVPLMGTPDKPGQYVLSFYAWSVGESNLTFYTDIYEYWEGDHYYYITDHTVGAEVTKFELPITYTAGQRNLSVRFHTNQVWGNPDAYICITDVKLEEGTKATDWSSNNEEFKAGSSIVMTSEGIRMSGGEIAMNAGTAFRVNSGGSVQIASGGTIQIDTASGQDSHINLGDGNFSASKDGGVVADSGHFGSALDVSGRRVLTLGDVSHKIVISSSDPGGTDLIWIKPFAMSSTSYTGYTASSRNETVDFARTNPISRTFKSVDKAVLSGGEITYSLTVPLYSVGSSLDWFTLSGSLSKNGQTVQLSAVDCTIRPWKDSTVTLTARSYVNLCGDVGDITVTLYGDRHGLGGNVYLQKETNMTLSCTVESANGMMDCAVKYIPIGLKHSEIIAEPGTVLGNFGGRVFTTNVWGFCCVVDAFNGVYRGPVLASPIASGAPITTSDGFTLTYAGQRGDGWYYTSMSAFMPTSIAYTSAYPLINAITGTVYNDDVAAIANDIIRYYNREI